jgi:hypothetical protein
MSATPAFGVRVVRATRKGRGSGFGIVVTTFAELGRALAAAQRYEDLRYRSAGHGNIDPAAIPPRIFEEFYAFGEAAEARSTIPAPEPRTGRRRGADQRPTPGRPLPA